MWIYEKRLQCPVNIKETNAKLAQAIISLLTDQKRLAEFSAHAYQDSARYSAANVMKLWNELLSDMPKEVAD